ncbi:hypothetical protein Bbelb_397010, partial [Branchiostoma belcheri]
MPQRDNFTAEGVLPGRDGFAAQQGRWRADYRCGDGYTTADGSTAECDPCGIYPCCSPGRWCGITAAHCDCADCVDYRTTDPCCESWTVWFDRDDPTGTADAELLCPLHQEYPGRVCRAPTSIQARVRSTQQEASLTGEVFVAYNTLTGFKCLNADQTDNLCLDYEVRFCCQVFDVPWLEVFSTISGTGQTVYDAWSAGAGEEVLHNKCPVVEMWTSLNINQVKIFLASTEGNIELIFDGQNTDKFNWFSKDRLRSSPWTDISTEPQNVFSLEGVVNPRRPHAEKGLSLGHNPPYVLFVRGRTHTCFFRTARTGHARRSYSHVRVVNPQTARRKKFYMHLKFYGVSASRFQIRRIPYGEEGLADPCTWLHVPNNQLPLIKFSRRATYVNYDSVERCPALCIPTNGDVSGSNTYGGVATFTCDPGYSLVGASSLTCQSDRTWSGNLPTCEVTVQECPTLNAPPNGAVSGDNVLTFTCNTGYNLVGPSTLTCQGDGTWSGSPPTCEAVQCPTLSNPTNGDVSYSTGYYGDVASYSCDTGYSLNGYSTRTCQSSGSWSQSAPTCEVGQCPTLTSPVNGAVSGSNGYGGTLTFTCNTGYNLVGSSTLTCQSDLTWSGSSPTCSIVQCPLLAAPDNGGKTGGNSYQDVVTFSCNLGYDLVGSSSLTCRADATWSGSAPTCSLVQCPTVQSPTNGGSSGDNYYQGVMSFTCDSGYELEGSASITCQADGTWSDSAPSCAPVQCPLLAAPDYGEMTGDNYYQDVVTFLCDPGYELVGLSSLTCRADRTWSGIVPTCTPVQCPLLAAPNYGEMTGDNYYQDVVMFTCDFGYELDGFSSLTCEADRTWSGVEPTCTPVQCPLLTAPDYGEMTGDNYYQDVVTFLCDPGYELVGLSSLTCQADRTWSGTEPTCTRVQCPVPSSPVNGDSSGPNFFQDVVQFTCDQGYDLVGDSSSTCQADRTWSSNVPSCNDIDECSAANGGCDHVCTNKMGSFQCSCVAGFTLNVDSHSCD